MQRQADQWSTTQELLRMRSDLAAIRFMLKLMAFARRQAKFDPSQPRVPRGYENGGQWTDGDDAGAPTRDDGAGWPRRVPASDAPAGPVIIITPPPPEPPPGIGHNQGPPLDPPPEVPPREPAGKGPQLRVAWDAARWTSMAFKLLKGGPVLAAYTVILETTIWFAERYSPSINAYLAAPKTLDALRADVDVPARGTDVHHLVERAAGAREGFPANLVYGKANLVRISTFKHWEINAWFAWAQKVSDYQIPRAYLKGKPFEEHVRIGIEALKETGVMAP
ncbi:hypothetical protein [Aquabacter spiritensis]|uniref:Uncharacterized protein n=1 Tax=Aquabacter spiritensis TaxID=933073 RepID=A0A4V2UXQ1_9HYPH|nr:hypothetical protein [Aquabacter spiritensis]TCT04408.1 hypothetical protein EDC64_107226 [Aquabacter spiritensis]